MARKKYGRKYGSSRIIKGNLKKNAAKRQKGKVKAAKDLAFAATDKRTNWTQYMHQLIHIGGVGWVITPSQDTQTKSE